MVIGAISGQKRRYFGTNVASNSLVPSRVCCFGRYLGDQKDDDVVTAVTDACLLTSEVVIRVAVGVPVRASTQRDRKLSCDLRVVAVLGREWVCGQDRDRDLIMDGRVCDQAFLDERGCDLAGFSGWKRLRSGFSGWAWL